MSKRAVIRIPVEMVGPLIGLPDGLEILHIAVGNYGLAFDLVVTAPDMAETIPLAVPPTVHPLYEYEVADGTVRIVDADYPREQPQGESAASSTTGTTPS